MRTLLEALERRQLLAGDGDAFVAAFDQLDDRELTTQQMAVIMAEAALDDAYAQTAWGGENYWFQTSSGEVFAVWHGGAASDDDGDGAFDWSLTSITDAAGVVVPLQANSLSGTFTPWGAMNIVALNGAGEVVTYWWSPEAGARGFGVNGNGWSLTNINEVTDFSQTGPPPAFTGDTLTRMEGDTIVILADDDALHEQHVAITFTPGQTTPSGREWAAHRRGPNGGGTPGDGSGGGPGAVGDQTIQAGETISQNITITDGTLTVRGRVEGNIEQRGAGSVIVDGGTVTGNIDEHFGGDIQIINGGRVEGNAEERDAGDIIVDTNAFLAGNAMEHGQGDIRIDNGSTVEGNALEGGEGDILIFAGSILEGNAIGGSGGDIRVVDSRVDGNLEEGDFGSIEVLGLSHIDGNVIERGPGMVTVAATATVEGDVEQSG